MTSSTLPLFSAAEEAALFHSQSPGYFALLVRQPNRMVQSSHPLSVMDQVLPLVDCRLDTWISQAEFFRPNRRVVNLARIGLLFADLDTYRQPWANGRSPDQLAASVIYHCQEEGIPCPSILVFSGRGLQAKWFLDAALPRQALPRWNACQRHLIDRLAPLGADPAARDASRVLRLVTTVNSRSGEICRVVHVEHGDDGQPVRYSFEHLAEALLPLTRRDIEAGRKARAERLQVLQGGKRGHLCTFSGSRLAWDRLEDLRKLVQLRGGVKAGERMTHLFWQINFLLLSGATNPSLMYSEAAALAREFDPQWNYRSHELMTVYGKARAHAAGETVEFCGKRYPPLYTPRNSRLISELGISDVEQRQLRTIISRDIKLERGRVRGEAYRRASGVIDRASYLQSAADKRTRAQELRGQGLSVRAIAEQMGISSSSAGRYIAGGT